MSFKLSAVLAALILGLMLGFTGAWQWQSARVDAIAAEYKGFVGLTQSLGEAARKEALARDAQNLANKLKADNENKIALDTLRADNKRLRDVRARTSYLPSAPTNASRPDLACFDRAELEQSIRAFDTGLQGIVDEGGEAAVSLNTAKSWAQSQGEPH